MRTGLIPFNWRAGRLRLLGLALRWLRWLRLRSSLDGSTRRARRRRRARRQGFGNGVGPGRGRVSRPAPLRSGEPPCGGRASFWFTARCRRGATVGYHESSIGRGQAAARRRRAVDPKKESATNPEKKRRERRQAPPLRLRASHANEEPESKTLPTQPRSSEQGSPQLLTLVAVIGQSPNRQRSGDFPVPSVFSVPSVSIF